MSYIYGKNLVIEKLKQKEKVNQVIIQKGTKNHDVENIAKSRHMEIRYVEKKEMDRLCQGGNHQGVALEASDYETITLDELIHQQPNGKYPLFVCLDGLEDPHNLGAILRTCDAIGADGVIIGKHRCVGLTSTVAKVSTGAIEYVPVAMVTNIAQALNELKDHGFWIVGTDAKEAVDYRAVDYNMPTVIVIGSEGKGISKNVLEACDHKVFLPMVGHVTSLNASVAAALLLYQVHNSRNPL